LGGGFGIGAVDGGAAATLGWAATGGGAGLGGDAVTGAVVAAVVGVLVGVLMGVLVGALVGGPMVVDDPATGFATELTGAAELCAEPAAAAGAVGGPPVDGGAADEIGARAAVAAWVGG
jgi:hypothetical protein